MDTSKERSIAEAVVTVVSVMAVMPMVSGLVRVFSMVTGTREMGRGMVRGRGRLSTIVDLESRGSANERHDPDLLITRMSTLDER